MLSEPSRQRKTDTTWYHLNVESKTNQKNQTPTKKNNDLVTRGSNWMKVVKKHRLPVTRQTSTGDVMHNTKTVVNTAVRYTRMLLRINKS